MLRGLLNAACREGAAVGQACPECEEKEQPWWAVMGARYRSTELTSRKDETRFVEVESVQAQISIAAEKSPN